MKKIAFLLALLPLLSLSAFAKPQTVTIVSIRLGHLCDLFGIGINAGGISVGYFFTG